MVAAGLAPESSTETARLSLFNSLPTAKRAYSPTFDAKERERAQNARGEDAG
jgi:hypothetical protein